MPLLLDGELGDGASGEAEVSTDPPGFNCRAVEVSIRSSILTKSVPVLRVVKMTSVLSRSVPEAS